MDTGGDCGLLQEKRQLHQRIFSQCIVATIDAIFLGFKDAWMSVALKGPGSSAMS